MRYLRGILCVLLLTVSVMFAVDVVYSFYPTTLKVAGTGERFMVFTHTSDSTIKYFVEDAPQDMMEGDAVACIMYDIRHNGDILDDKVITWRCVSW